MHFRMRALPADQFDAWAKEVHQGTRRLDTAAYTELSKQSSPVPPLTFAAIDDQLFHRIVMQSLPPGARPGIRSRLGPAGSSSGHKP